MAYIISFANQKGGVGKTTSVVSIAGCLSALDKNVLVIDLDPQGSSTSGLGILKGSLKRTSYDVLTDSCSVNDAIIKTNFKNVSVIPSNVNLAGADFELTSLPNREFLLKNKLSEIRGGDIYDYVLIDCPPSIGITTLNALCASNGVIIPTQCEYYALEGISQLMMTIKKTKQMYNPRLCIVGILVTMFNGRLRLASQVYKELEKYYEDKLFDTKISRCVALGECPSYGEPINYYSRYSKGSLQYQKVADEILSRTFI